jgi:hypothetical protein
MKYLAALLPLLLCGCLATTQPVSVKQTWPTVPDELKETCPDLKQVPDDTEKLSVLITVVADNYGEYKECKLKVDNWIEWYNTQKKIYESVK